MLRADFPNALLGSDKASAQHTVPVIEHRRLPGGNSRSLHGKSYQQIAVLRQSDDLTRNRAASVPDAHRKIRACQKLLYIRSHGRFCQHVFGSQLIGISQHDRVLLGINFQYVCRFAQCDAQSFPLADGVIGKSFMLPQLYPFAVYEPSRTDTLIDIGTMFTQELPVILVDKANLHAFPSFRFRLKSFMGKVFADLFLGHSAQREQHPA